MELLRKTVSGTILIIISIGMLTSAFNLRLVKAESTIWTVDDDGPADFHKVQEAINSPIFSRKENGAYMHSILRKLRLKSLPELNEHVKLVELISILNL